MTERSDYDFTRRGLLGAAAAGAGGLALIGCGGGGSGNSGTTPAPGTPARGGGTPKRGGTFRLGLSDSGSGDSVDPLDGQATETNIARCTALYDTLIRRDLDAQSYSNHLAESLDPAKDLSYWDVRLVDAEWHDGKPVTADDVIFTLKRVLNPKKPGSASGLISTVDTQRLKKMDAKTVRIYLTTPDSALPGGLSRPGCSIIPVDFDPKKPVGSGPFKFKSFIPGRQSVFIRNENYWKNGQPYLDQLEFIGFADPGTTRINALTSGQIDGADHILRNLVSTVEANGNLVLLSSKSYAYHTWEMRMDVPPFNDPRVRQAIKLIADREQIINQAFGGSRFASVANDLPSRQDPAYNTTLQQRTQDLEQAKSVLKQAGRSDLRVELAVSPGISAGVVETAQVLAEQAKAAGVTIKVNSIPDSAAYFSKYYAQSPFKFNYFNTEELLVHVGYSLLPKSPYNISNYRDSQFVKLLTDARGEPDEAKRKTALQDAQKIFWDNGTQAIFAFSNTADAYNKKFTGFKTDIWADGLNHLQFDNVGLA
jgi:peptide/nickel transport system substrate-binding protein